MEKGLVQLETHFGLDSGPRATITTTYTIRLSGEPMPNDSHQRAAEFHEMAAHAHRAAAVSHGKGDHLTGHELSKQALEHAKKAFEWSQEANRKSEAAAKP